MSATIYDASVIIPLKEGKDREGNPQFAIAVRQKAWVEGTPLIWLNAKENLFNDIKPGDMVTFTGNLNSKEGPKGEAQFSTNIDSLQHKSLHTKIPLRVAAFKTKEEHTFNAVVAYRMDKEEDNLVTIPLGKDSTGQLDKLKKGDEISLTGYTYSVEKTDEENGKVYTNHYIRPKKFYRKNEVEISYDEMLKQAEQEFKAVEQQTPESEEEKKTKNEISMS